MIIKNIHEKLLNGIQTMLIDTKINLPYYGEFNLHVSFHEQDSIGTCAVNVTSKGMNFYYSPKFLEDMSQNEVNFIKYTKTFAYFLTTLAEQLLVNTTTNYQILPKI